MHHKDPARRRQKGAEDIFKDIRAENFPNLGKETNIISKSRKHRDTPTGLIQKGAHKDTLHFKNKILKREY